MDKLEIDIDKSWGVKNKSEQDLIGSYLKIKRSVEKRIEKNVVKKSNDIYGAFRLLAGCSRINCWKSVSRGLLKDGFDTGEVCEFSSGGGYNNISFESDYFRNEDKRIKRRSKINKFTDKGSFSCRVDLRARERFESDNIYIDVKNTYGISDFSYKNAQDFARNGELSRSIRHMAKVKYKNTFYKTYSKKFKREINKKIKISMNNKFGFTVPLTLDEKGFFMNENIKKHLDKKLGVYSKNVFEMGLEKDEFYRKYKKHMSKELGMSYKDNIKESDFVDDIFKITIIPIIGVTFSLIFGLINLALIIKEILCYSFRINNNHMGTAVFGLIAIIIFITPLFLNNYYTEHKEFDVIFNSFKDTNIIVAYFYKWFLNAETLVYSLSEYYYLEIPFNENNYLGK